MELDVATITEAIAAAHPDRECLVYRERRFTWQQIRDRSRRLARLLHDAGLGVRAPFGEGPLWESVHDHVALYLHNGNEYLEGMLGAWKARCAPFNVNYRYVAEELTYLLDDSHAAAMIVHRCFLPVLTEVLPGLRRAPRLLLVVEDGSDHPSPDGALEYEDALASASLSLPEELVGGWSGDDLYLCYTGGTTGMPKGAMWRQADFLVAALGVRHPEGREFHNIEEVVAAARGTVRALPAPPLMHGAAHWNALSCWVAGGTVIIQDHPEHLDPDDILDSIERHGATSLLVVGDPVARPLADAQRRRPRHLGTLRHLLSGGAVLSPGLKAELLELHPGLTIVDVLGSTESGRQGVATIGPGGDPAATFAPSATAAVLSNDLSRHLQPGHEELGWLAQTGRVPLGYLGDAEKTAATFPEIEGIRHAVAGDRARWRHDGTIELHGRDSACINTGGEKVFAEEVETALKAHPDVFDAVVCGRESPRWGQEVVALVQLRDGRSPADAELLAAAGTHLARYKLPKQILRLPALVRSPAGKADYRWAREVAVKGRVPQAMAELDAAPTPTRLVGIEGPFDLLRTLRPLADGGGDPTWRFDRSGPAPRAVRAMWTPEGAATIELRHEVPDAVAATGWGPGADWVLDRLPWLIGSQDSADGFRSHLHPRLATIHRRLPGIRQARSLGVWDLVVPTVLGQRVTTGEARRIWRRLVWRHGHAAPGLPEVRLAPRPETVARLGDADWHVLGVERARVDAVRGLLRVLPALERLAAQLEAPEPDRTARFRRVAESVRGVGPWTSTALASGALGDPDVVLLGDLHLPNTVCHALAGEPRGDDRRMLELLEPFRPHRGRVVRLLKAGGEGAPRRGPHLTPLQIREL